MKKFLIAFLIILLHGAIISQANGANPTTTPTPTPDPTKVTLKIDSSRLLWLDTEIDEKVASSFNSDLMDLETADHTKPIYIIIDSPGGALESGFSIENTMDALQSPLVCVVSDYAASMASSIFLHCDTKYMMPHSRLLFHWGSVHIDADRLEAKRLFELVMKEFDQFDQDNANRLGLTLKAYRAKIANDWWLTDSDALKAHAADGILYKFQLPKKVVKDDDSLLKIFD